MRKLFFFCIVLAVFVLAAMVTKPSDEHCIVLVKEAIGVQVQGGGVASELINGITDAGAEVIYQVQDHGIYKAVTNRLTGEPVAVVWFGIAIIE